MVEKPRYCAIESVGDQASEVVHPDGKQSLINNTNSLKPFAIIEAQEPAVDLSDGQFSERCDVDG